MPAQLKEVNALVKTLRLLMDKQVKAAREQVEEQRAVVALKPDAWKESALGEEWEQYLTHSEKLIEEVDNLYMDSYVDLSEFPDIK